MVNASVVAFHPHLHSRPSTSSYTVLSSFWSQEILARGFRKSATIMPFTSSIEEVEKYLQAEFLPIYPDLIALDPTGAPCKWQEELHSSLNSRLSGIDFTKQSWKTTASHLCITTQEVRLMLQAYPPSLRPQKKQYLVASANKANYITNVLLGRAPTKYPDVERPAFEEGDEGYEHFLLKSIKELLRCDPRTTMYNRFFFAAKLKCVNDRGRIPSNLELQAVENLPFSKGWNDRYGFILIFGDSPLDSRTRLSQASIQKAEISLSHTGPSFSTRFITCGTSIRPFGTTIVEACELKQYLVSHPVHPVSPDHILIETMSEHTNTNIWNAALLAFEAGMLFEKKMIVFLLESQLEWVLGPGMERRTRKEVWPGLGEYLTIERGEVEGSVVIGFKETFRTCQKWRLQWRNHVGRNIEIEDV